MGFRLALKHPCAAPIAINDEAAHQTKVAVRAQLETGRPTAWQVAQARAVRAFNAQAVVLANRSQTQ